MTLQATSCVHGGQSVGVMCVLVQFHLVVFKAVPWSPKWSRAYLCDGTGSSSGVKAVCAH